MKSFLVLFDQFGKSAIARVTWKGLSSPTSKVAGIRVTNHWMFSRYQA